MNAIYRSISHACAAKTTNKHSLARYCTTNKESEDQSIGPHEPNGPSLSSKDLKINLPSLSMFGDKNMFAAGLKAVPVNWAPLEDAFGALVANATFGAAAFAALVSNDAAAFDAANEANRLPPR